MASPLRVPPRIRVKQPRILAVDAPVGGWNARDSLDDMDPTDAVTLDNWVPGFSDVYIRPGYQEYGTGVGAGDVDSLMVFDDVSAKMLAAGGGAVYDATAGGAMGAPLASGFVNNQWQSDMFINKLVMVNGADTPQSYNGTVLGAETLTGPADPKVLKGCLTHKSRMYFWENNSDQFWYSGTLALGTITAFPQSGIATKGGVIIDMVSWTRETSGGLDAYLVVFMSSGVALVYAGSDPSSATGFALVGVFDIGVAVGIRSTLTLGSDAVVATSDGYQPLAVALQGGRSATSFNVSDKIQQAVARQIFETGGNFGWELEHYPLRNWLLVNYPISAGLYGQHVCNLKTGAWCRFTGIPARTWRLFNERLYFGGGGGRIFLYDNTANDDGSDLTAEAISAFNYLGSRGHRKMVNNIRILASSDGNLPLEVSVEHDLGVGVPSGVVSEFIPSEVGTAEWDKADWDVDSWAGRQIARDKWLDRGNLGYSFATRLRYTGQGREIFWFNHTYSFDYASAI